MKEMVCTNGNQKLLFRSIYEGGGWVFRWVWVCLWVCGCVCVNEKKNKTRSVLNGSHNCWIGLLPLNIKFKFIRKLNINFNDNFCLFNLVKSSLIHIIMLNKLEIAFNNEHLKQFSRT